LLTTYRAQVDSYWKYLDTTFTNSSVVSYRKKTIEKWNKKLQLASGKTPDGSSSGGGGGGGGLSSHLKVLNQSVLNQIDHALLDSDNLIKKTQLKKGDFRFFPRFLSLSSFPSSPPSSSPCLSFLCVLVSLCLPLLPAFPSLVSFDMQFYLTRIIVKFAGVDFTKQNILDQSVRLSVCLGLINLFKRVAFVPSQPR
jgi:hypothetical protein